MYATKKTVERGSSLLSQAEEFSYTTRDLSSVISLVKTLTKRYDPEVSIQVKFLLISLC